MIKVNREELLKCTAEILSALGESKPGAEFAAESMVFADSRGITTHGTYLLTPIVNRAKAGQLILPTKILTLIDNAAVAVIDGGNGLGALSGKAGIEQCAKSASQFGISLVLVRNTNNLGALAFYTEQISKQGMIAMVGCNAAPAMAPWGGAEAFLGTNPFAISFYTGENLLFSADMATSIVARGKIRKAAREGKTIPDSWALDVDGNLTTDPVEALKGALLPMGGPKGSAIAMAIDILAGMMSGSAYAPDIKSFHALDGTTGVGAFFMAIDISKFMPLEQFEKSINEYFDKVKRLKKAGFTSEIYLPGEIEQLNEVKNNQDGIPLDEKTAEVIESFLDEFGIREKMSLLA
jgi:LDH2 family malate/lactate/ureidoglycolate dehydrogenase